MTLKELLKDTEKLSITDRWQLVRHVLNGLETSETAKITRQEDWASFVNRMYGALADNPIERANKFALQRNYPVDRMVFPQRALLENEPDS